MEHIVTKSELGRMALKAAINIERSQINKPADMSAVKTFLDTLSAELDPSDSPNILRDETMFPYYSSALAKADAVELFTRNQFSAAFKSALQRHQNATSSGDSLEQVKQFCLAFHEAMVRAMQQHMLGNPRVDGRVR